MDYLEDECIGMDNEYNIQDTPLDLCDTGTITKVGWNRISYLYQRLIEEGKVQIAA